MLSLSFSSILRPRGLSLRSAVLVGLLVGQLVVTMTEAEPEPRRRSRGRGKVAKMEEETEVEEPGMNRDEKLLNIFQVVRFPNDACNTTAGDSGVCFTAAECTTRGGNNAGTCASGFGVCCSFSIGCGGETSQNNTYFSSSDNDVSPCTAKICRCSSDICQLRLDFDTFNIAQPDTTAPVAGSPVQHTQCINAVFSATSDGTSPPLLCGTNTGEHMIVEVSDSCNELAFSWLTSNPRVWRIKVSQISCNDPHKPPEGCTQYYTGTSGTVQTYNFQGGVHLANQNQEICFRTEQGQCEIDLTHAANAFMVTNPPVAPNTINTQGDFCSQDYVLIPGGFDTGEDDDTDTDRYCGILINTLRDNTNGGITAPGTVVTNKKPFSITFVSNSGESLDNLDNVNQGFQFMWEQKAEHCQNV